VRTIAAKLVVGSRKVTEIAATSEGESASEAYGRRGNRQESMVSEMSRNPRPDEAAAAKILADVLQANPHWIGCGDTHDYELHYTVGAFDALEVTRLTDEGWRRLQAGLLKEVAPLDAHGKLTRSWAVWLADEAKSERRTARIVRKRIVELLAPIDASRIQRVDRRTDYDWRFRRYRTPDIEALFMELPIDHAWAIPSPHPRVFLSPPGSAAYLGGHVVHNAIAEFLQESDRAKDVAKLSRPSSATRRHLFVWVEEVGDTFGVGASLFEPTPSLTPSLPAPITDIWVACDRISVVALWHSTGTSHWRSVGLPKRYSVASA
jgi:hypothetical protein